MYQPDEKDFDILRVLLKNSHLSIQKISKKTGIPIATVHHRIKKLKEQGIIDHYTIKINMEKLGRKMTAYILVKAMPRADHSIILKEVGNHGLIEEGSMITGEFDLIFKAIIKDMDELNTVVVKYMRSLETIAETRTMISYENVENEEAGVF
ncbi:Lrp/AsnC family transcriptional regulator [Candidatus Micrarchaeota archaeon]|nr:Lrp/AsnC family transcriptional regulator [Candidatus Micrarchaeota archaeon]